VPAASLTARYALPAEEIERRSLAMVEAALPACSGWTSEAREVVKRMVYAAGDLAIAGLVRVHPEAVTAGLAALRARAPIVCDVRMVAAGLRAYEGRIEVAVDAQRRVQRGPRPEAAVAPLPAGQEPATRVAHGIATLEPQLDGGIAVIGNAPTALLALLDLIDAGRCAPALIVATPVGFVAAAESKQELMRRNVPYITVEGTRGGSPLAAAALNALLILADSDR
jgi:precorrin-8X/cobalt-precorrin-8 methylmutase